MLHRHYPASSLFRASPPPLTAQPGPRGLLAGSFDLPPCWVSRVITELLLHPCRRYYPGGRTRCFLRSLHAPCLPSPLSNRVGVRITFFEACSAFTHITAWLLADSLNELLTSGASTAAVASDVRPNCFRRSESCRVGFSLPHGSSARSTAHWKSRLAKRFRRRHFH